MENKEENSDKINKKLLDNRERNISPIGKKEESEGEIGTSKMDVECVVTTVKEESMETNDEYGKKGGTRDDILPELDKDQEINYDINISFNECKNENEHETITKKLAFFRYFLYIYYCFILYLRQKLIFSYSIYLIVYLFV